MTSWGGTFSRMLSYLLPITEVIARKFRLSRQYTIQFPTRMRIRHFLGSVMKGITLWRRMENRLSSGETIKIHPFCNAILFLTCQTYSKEARSSNRFHLLAIFLHLARGNLNIRALHSDIKCSPRALVYFFLWSRYMHRRELHIRLAVSVI